MLGVVEPVAIFREGYEFIKNIYTLTNEQACACSGDGGACIEDRQKCCRQEKSRDWN